jgi:DNA-binding CsgD family transcriptional regulator
MGSAKPFPPARPDLVTGPVASSIGASEPDLRRIIAQLRARLDHQAHALQMAAALLQELPLACLVTDQAGRCLDGNQVLMQMLGAGAMQLATGRVRFDDPEAQREWEEGLVETHVTGLGRTLQIAPRDGPAWRIHLRPWYAPEGLEDAADPRLMLAVFEPQPQAVAAAPDHSASTARLTQAELQVLASLLKGLPAKGIAALRGASVNTVRSQIMTILEKTGFRSQKELIATFGHSGLETTGFAHSSSYSRDGKDR